jgi:hypothetical protein
MAISDILFEAEVAINDYLNTGYCGANDDPVREAVISLLAHMQTVRQLPGLDQQPHEAVHRAGVEKAASSDSNDEWDQD